MKKGRLEAFTDGVIAIIITIMVLELRVPQGTSIRNLEPLLPIAISYLLSFINIGIYWVNHHHMLYAADRINGAILWGNLNLLFWLSLLPFATAWMGENHFAKWPVIIYGVDLLMAGISYWLLCVLLINECGPGSQLALALGSDWKGKSSVGIYAVAVGLAFLNSWLAFGLYVLVAVIWFIPDSRIERQISDASVTGSSDRSA
jgi:uncharacterized membrane protein